MKEKVTLRQLAEMLLSLPEETQNKQIGYLDLSHIDEGDLAELKERMLSSDDELIKAYC